MTAEEWIKSTFPVYQDEGKLRFVAVQSGDFAHWLPDDPDRVSAVDADVESFVAWFGAIISSALSQGENPVDHLVALPHELQRGWGGVFRLWKAREI